MSRAWVIIKRCSRYLKYVFICLIITVCILMLWRVLFTTGTPNELKVLTPNESLNAAYEQYGKELYIFRQNYDELTYDETAYGYFAVPEAKFIPDANQAQLVFRYNNSTIEHIAQDYSLPSVPDRSEELFDVSLVLLVDLTPENKEDNQIEGTDTLKEIRCLPSDGELSDKTRLYNFYRYVFDFNSTEEEVDLRELLDSGALVSVTAHFYYLGDLDYEKAPLGTLCIYDYRAQIREVDLSRKDIKALEGN